MKTNSLFLSIAFIFVTSVVAHGQTNTPAPATTTTTTNTTAQLEAQVTSLTKQVGDLSKLLSEFAKAHAELASALTNRPTGAPQAPRQPTHTWVNGQLVPIGAGGGTPQQTGVAVNMEHILRNAPGRVVNVTVAPQRLGTPYNAHISADGSTFYSLAPGRGN